VRGVARWGEKELPVRKLLACLLSAVFQKRRAAIVKLYKL
jgi:hypothetical protein